MKNQEKILICDGDDLRARSLAMAFSESSPDWAIGIVQRGQDGLNMLRESSHDCILLQETGIPDTEGLSLLKEIRELDGGVPIILLSKKPLLNKVLEAIHLGIFDYLKEPYTITEVLNVVRLAIEKNKLQMDKERLLQELQDDKEKLVKKEDKKKGKEEKRGGSPMEPPLKSEQLLSKCLTLSMDLLQANKGVAFLVDKKSNRLIVKETIGFDDYFLKDSSFDLKDKKDLGKVVSQGKPCIISRENIRLACAPLGNPPLVFGVIGLGRPWSFTDSDLKILSVFTPLAPYSLEGARVHTELEAARLGSIRSLLILLDAKDPELRQHALRVMEYSKTLAEFIQVPKATISSIKFASLLHEVGKIPEVTSSGDGFQRMTDRIVEPLKIPEKVKLILHHQSERFDGKGEPDGLKGEDIPLGSRILAIADAYDEGISSGRSEDEILEGISAFAGTQFDPLLIETLVSIRNADEEEDPYSEFESASSSDEPIQYSSQSA